MARRKPTPIATVESPSPNQEATIAHGLPNVSPHVEAEVARLSKKIRRYVRRDIEEQRAQVEALMVEGAGARQITRILRAQVDPRTKLPLWPNITPVTVRKRMEQVRALRVADAKHDRVTMREDMIERLHKTRQRALANEDYKAAVACEKEIAKLSGLYAPTKVDVSGDVNHSHAMVAVIAGMDPELAGELLEEARSNERLANEARRLLPAIIDVEAETVPREAVATPAALKR